MNYAYTIIIIYGVLLACTDALVHCEATALINSGFLTMLVQMDKLDDYWNHMLRDFPDHPAKEETMQSVPICLYGSLISNFVSNIYAPCTFSHSFKQITCNISGIVH